MNKLVIPPPPSWYESNVLACAPDNTVIYASRQDVVIISPKPPEEPADINTVLRCHQDRIVAVVICPKWGEPDKLVATIGEDKVVNLLDVTTRKIKIAHSGHTTRQDKLVGVTFAGHDRIISVSEDGFIVIWRWVNNQLNSLSDLLGSKSKVTCVSSCPHATWLTAFGLKRGDILVTDLRKTGRIMHRLRGHDSNIISLSWCPTPYNVFPKMIIRFLTKPEKVKEDEHCDNVEKKETESLNQDEPESIKSVDDDAKNICAEHQGTEENSIMLSEKVLTEENVGTKDVVEDNEATIHPEHESQTIVPEFKKEIVKEHATEENQTVPTKIEEENTSTPHLIDTVIDFTELILAKNAESKPANVCETEEKIICPDKVVNLNIKVDPTLTESNERTIPIQTGSSNSPENPIASTDIKSAEEDENSSPKPIIENGKLEDLSHENIEPNKDLLIENQELIELQSEPETIEPVKEYLLASSSRGGRVINIWRAGTDGVNQIQLMLPPPKSRGNQRSHQSEEKSWITLCWVTPKNLLSSSPKGELLQWKLAEPKRSYKPRVIHGDHRKHIFGIAAPIRLHESPEDEDWREKNLLNAWTIGKDRFIRNTSLCSKREPLASYQTFAGSIYCLVPSVDFPSKIAIGAAEGCRLWDLNLRHCQYIVMTNFFEKMQHKIISLAWHPQKDSIMAYGTMDGRIGFLDPCNTSKATNYLVQYANTAVHKLEWGPFKGNLQEFLLYAVVNGKLIAYDYNQKLQAPIVFEMDEVLTQMAWKPDYSVCAVAAKGGHVLLYSSEMKLITTLYLQNKSVRWMTWHPLATSEDDGVSPYVDWLAVATNDVTVYDCSINDDLKSNYADRIVAVFKDHTKFVECLSWSTFEGGKLASCGDDGLSMVWDVKTKTLLHTCVVTNDILTSVLWSPVDRDYILTGCKSGMLQIWKLSENPPQVKRVRRSAHKLLELKDEADTAENSGEETEVVEEIQKPNRSHRRYVLAGLVEAQNRNNFPAVLEDCKRFFAMTYGKSNNTSETENTESNQPLDPLKMFGNESDVNLLMNLERKGNAKKKIVRGPSHIHLWHGTTATVIRDAINTKSLNPWIINMAPSVSHDLYLEACESYADNLPDDNAGNVYEAVSYYLLCHQLPKAIELLCKTKNYVEALMLAKCRLVLTDPLITKIIERWAADCARTGSFEVAVQCYIALNQPEQAAKVLFKRTDRESLKLCAELAKLGDDKDFLNAVLFKINMLEEEEKQEPEVPLLSRIELELQLKKIPENNVEEESKIVKDLGICTDVLGDGQNMNGASCPNDLKTVDNEI